MSRQSLGLVAQWIRHRPTEPGIDPAEIIVFHRASGCCCELCAYASCEGDTRLAAPQHVWRAGAMPHAVGGLRMRGERSRSARATPTSANSWSRARARSNESVTEDMPPYEWQVHVNEVTYVLDVVCAAVGDIPEQSIETLAS